MKHLFYLVLCFFAITNSVNAQGTWTQKADHAGGVRFATVGLSIGAKGYIGTGLINNPGVHTKEFWEWNQVTNVWTQKADFGGTARYYAAGFVIGSKAYIGTGADGTNVEQDFWEWDQATNVWTQRADFGGGPRMRARGVSIGNKGYFTVGTNPNVYANMIMDLWEYDPNLNPPMGTWTQKASFPGAPRNYPAVFSICGKMYLGTGTNGSPNNATSMNDFWEWDPATNIWTQKANFPGIASNQTVGFGIGAKGYMGVGRSAYDGTYLTQFYEYNPSTDTWTTMADFAGVPRAYSMGFSICNKGYVGTGLVGGAPMADFWEFTSPPSNNPPTTQINATCPQATDGAATVYPTCGAPPYTYNWNTLPVQTTATAIGLAVGSYTVNILDSLGCASTATVNILSANTIHTITAASDQTVCQNAAITNITMTLGGGATGATVTGLPAGVTSSVVGITVTISGTPTVIGSFPYTVTTTGNACTVATTNATITASPIHTITAASDQTVCQNAAITNITMTLGGGATGATVTGLPTGVASSVVGTTLTISGTPSVNGTFAYTVTTTGNACTVATTNETITVSPIHTIAAASDQTVCQNAAITNITMTLGGGATGATVTGLPAGVTLSVSGTTITISGTPTVSGLFAYTVTTTGNACTVATTNATITVNPIHTITAASDQTVCQNAAITNITMTLGGGATGATVTGLPAGVTLSVVGTTVTISGIPTVSGSFSYTVTTTGNACTVATTNATITASPTPTVSVSPAAPAICIGSSTTLTANGATTYSWSPTTGLSTTTGTTVDATPLTTTTYTVTGTTNGCSANASFDITVNNSPTVVVSPAVALCGGQTTTLTASGATTYAWSPATGLSATTGGSVDATPTTTTTYTVVGTTLGCTDTQTIDIMVTPYPIVTVTPPASSICLGDSKGFTAAGATTYVWSPATGLNTTTGPTVTADPTATTTYQVIGSTNGCNDTAWAVLTVNPIPVTTVSPDVTICSGTSTPLAAGGATTYSWTPTTGLSAATGANVTANPMLTTTYTVTGTSLSCTSSATMTVTVNQTPTVTVSPTQFAFCDGGSTNLSASGAASYSWSPATGLNQTTGANVTANPTSTTTYTVVGSTLGCIDDATSTITVYPNPVVDFAVDNPSGCVPHCVVFANASTIATGSNTYSWEFGNGETTNGINQAYCYADTGTYSVTLTATSNNNCVTTLQKVDYISAYPNPVARFSVKPQSASVLSPKFQFTDNSSGATEWYWSFGDGTTVQNLITTPAHVYPTNIDSGTYTVNLEVINQYGCVDETTLDVYITPHISIYIPNAFSPNDDNHNNTFRAYGENIKEFQMWIFNRWGQEIFYTAVMEKGWDGTYKGKQVENDVYVYRIVYRDIEGTEGNPSGSVTLFR